jgi:PPM family protein phosphatase
MVELVSRVTPAWQAVGGTHVGRRRKGNEDAFRVDTERGIFIVADGMGGHAAGEIASRIAADTALELLTAAMDEGRPVDDALRATFEEAQRRITTCCTDEPATKGMGTTLTTAVVSPVGVVTIGHIGDSRAYVYSKGAVTQLTIDHSWVQQEVDAGRLTLEASRSHPLSHILTRVLSSSDLARPDLVTSQLQPGDLLLLCSDGLYNMVDPASLLGFLQLDLAPAALVDQLIAAANKKGGADNITLIAVLLS